MKKKYIQLGVVALVLAIMAGALVLLRREPAAEAVPETPAAEIIYIYGGAETETTAPKQIDIHNESGDITIDNITPADAPPAVTAELTLRGLENLSLDTFGLSQAASNARAMRAKEVISENATADELKTFGLENPRASITVHLQNGDKPVVLFGDSAPGGEGVYVKPENGSTIYLIADSTAAPYFKPATAYVNKTITATDPEFSGFDKVTLSGTNYPETLVIERTPETEISGAGVTLNTHSFTSPIRRGLDSQRGLEPLTSVYGLMANDVVAVDDSDAALEKYGLKEPATVISVVSGTPELTFTLRISNPAENGEVRLIKDGSKVIYELSPSALPFLNKTLFEMMDKMVIVPNIQTVSKVILTTPEKSYEFVLTQEDEGRKLDVTANGAPLPNVTDENGKEVTGGENFRKLYQTIIACRYEEPMVEVDASEDTSADETDEPEEIGEDEPELVPDAAFLASIEYVYNNGRASDVVSFYEGPPRRTEIRLNGEGDYYGQSIYLDRLLEDTEKVVNGIAVKTYL